MSFHTFISSAIVATSLALVPVASAADQGDPVDRSAAVYELAQRTAPIKSQNDLRVHLNRGLDDSPLRHLSRDALRRFLNSLTFNHNGVTGFSYEDLELELTATQAYELLALFGQQQFVRQLTGARVETQLDAELIRGDVPGVGLYCTMYPIISPLGEGAVGQETIQCDGFLKDYRCESSGTCAFSVRKACTSNC